MRFYVQMELSTEEHCSMADDWVRIRAEKINKEHEAAEFQRLNNQILLQKAKTFWGKLVSKVVSDIKEINKIPGKRGIEFREGQPNAWSIFQNDLPALRVELA